MRRIPVSSSDLRAVGYDSASQTLEIEFHSGGIFQYSGVPQPQYQNLMAADSHGWYFHAHIKARYPWRRVG